MTTKTIEVTPDFEKFIKDLRRVIDDPEARRLVLLRSSLELKDRFAVYPPAGPWNMEPGVSGRGWYQRKFGPRWRRRDGTLNGKNTSQLLQTSWQREVQQRDEFTASVYTRVTYAPYLYDPAQRVHWAAEHGWQTIDEIVEDYKPRFVELILKSIDDEIDKL